MNIEVVYRCPICKTVFEEPGAAVACLASDPPVPDLRPGDILKDVHNGFGWYDRDPAWIEETHPGDPKAEHHFDRMKLFDFYWVVRRVYRAEGEPHRYCAEVLTGAIKGGRTGYIYLDSRPFSKVPLESVPAKVQDIAERYARKLSVAKLTGRTSLLS